MSAGFGVSFFISEEKNTLYSCGKTTLSLLNSETSIPKPTKLNGII